MPFEPFPYLRACFEMFDDGLHNLGHGQALWEHKPARRDIQIGDVGYFSAGQFAFLFSVTAPNKDLDLPANFEELPYDEATDVVVEHGCLKAGVVYKSPKVTVTQSTETDTSE